MRARSKLRDVAWWEFRRFLRVKDLIWSVLLVFLGALGIRTVGALVENAGTAAVKIVASPAALLPLEAGEYGRFVIEESDAPELELRDRLANKEVDAVLLFDDRDRVNLVVRSEALWHEELMTLLSAARKDQRLAASGISPEQLDELVEPLRFELSFADPAREARGSGRLGALVMLGLMFLGLLTGFSYLLVGLTAEKNQRVTEQVIAAISPQTWVDGKILGLSGLVVVSLLLYVLGYFLYMLVAAPIWGDALSLPALISDPVLFAAVFVLALLGFFLWFSFFAVVASTINDPNTSSRSIIMLIPFLPLAIAFAALVDPDVVWLRVFGVLPFTSPTVLSARLVLGEVAAWEFPVAVVLLLATIWFLRRTAGKIFGISMLMYGKEPNWGEVVRWAKEAP